MTKSRSFYANYSARRCLDWANRVFGKETAGSKRELALRFMEEAVELGQAAGLSHGDLLHIGERVYTRPAGEVEKEIGQTRMTLDMLAHVHGTTSAKQASAEFHRVQCIPDEDWHARHAAKIEVGIALPMSSEDDESKSESQTDTSDTLGS